VKKGKNSKEDLLRTKKKREEILRLWKEKDALNQIKEKTVRQTEETQHLWKEKKDLDPASTTRNGKKTLEIRQKNPDRSLLPQDRTLYPPKTDVEENLETAETTIKKERSLQVVLTPLYRKYMIEGLNFIPRT